MREVNFWIAIICLVAVEMTAGFAVKNYEDYEKYFSVVDDGWSVFCECTKNSFQNSRSTRHHC